MPLLILTTGLELFCFSWLQLVIFHIFRHGHVAPVTPLQIDNNCSGGHEASVRGAPLWLEAHRLNNYVWNSSQPCGQTPGFNWPDDLKSLFEQARSSQYVCNYLHRKWLTGELPPLPAWMSTLVFWNWSALPLSVVEFSKRPYGVNLIGHAWDVWYWRRYANTFLFVAAFHAV